MQSRRLSRTGVSSILAAGVFALVGISSQAREIDDVRSHVDRVVENSIRQSVDDRLQQSVRDDIQRSIHRSVEQQVDGMVTDVLTSDVIGPEPGTDLTGYAVPIESETLTSSTANIEATSQSSPAPQTVEPVKNRRVPGTTDKVVTTVGSNVARIDIALDRHVEQIRGELDQAIGVIVDAQGEAALREEWLVLSDMPSLLALQSEGYQLTNIEELDGLGYVLGTISAPTTFDPGKAGLASVQIVNSPTLAVDVNHVYMPQRGLEGPLSRYPLPELGFPQKNASPWPSIGMIDSTIDTNHPVFANSKITELAFTPKGFTQSVKHGTAIASILVGDTRDFHGFTPDSQLFNGSVFARDENGVEFSTTAAIVRALNWLAEQDVKLINMSLAGPDNVILSRVIDSACEKGITIVTSVGNEGPAAPVLYPAGYDCTIAVSAVNENNASYHRSNRGSHVDFAAPGVNIRHATGTSGYSFSSGTSYAAAVLTGYIATNIPFAAEVGRAGAATPVSIKTALVQIASDIGIRGKDAIYGFGVITPPVRAYSER